MGFGFDIGVEGEESLEGLQLALKNLPLHLTEEVHIAALKKAAKPLRNEIEQNAPKYTWDFVETLRVAKTKFKNLGEHQVVVGFKKGRQNGEPLKGIIAHFHEYGTSKMPAKPFMRPADSRTAKEQDRIYEEQLQKEVDKRIDGL